MADKSRDVVSHWYQLVEGMKHSTQAFYVTLGRKLDVREIPNSKVASVEYAEGGIFSGKRSYFRVTRKDLIFDVCAAPFGSGFFVSWWLTRTVGGCLSQIPIVGWIIQRFIKPTTYYAIDTALMFQEAVHKAVQEVVDEVTNAQGLRALSEFERKPILHNLYGGK